MSDLSSMTCVPCEGGVAPLNRIQAEKLLKDLDAGWVIDEDCSAITRRFEFKGFYKTMGFVNAVAFIANQQNHHPDMRVGYNYCEITFMTHAINGLSDNDFICASKVDVLGSA